MASSQSSKSRTAADKEGSALYDKRIDLPFNRGSKCSLKVIMDARVQNCQSWSIGRQRRLRFSDFALGKWAIWVYQQSEHLYLRQSLRSISIRLAVSVVVNRVTPVKFPPGLFRPATGPAATGSLPTAKTTGVFRQPPLPQNDGVATSRNDYSHVHTAKSAANPGNRSYC